MSVFDENNVNVSQFVQLTETFLGENPDTESFNKLLGFLRTGYEETEDEKMERLMKVLSMMMMMTMILVAMVVTEG